MDYYIYGEVVRVYVNMYVPITVGSNSIQYKELPFLWVYYTPMECYGCGRSCRLPAPSMYHYGCGALWDCYALKKLWRKCIMTKKERNDYLYQKLMESRKRNPKHYGLSIIGASYEDVRHYANSKECIKEELKEKVRKLSMRIKEVSAMYSITGAEVRSYFQFHNYSLSF